MPSVEHWAPEPYVAHWEPEPTSWKVPGREPSAAHWEPVPISWKAPGREPSVEHWEPVQERFLLLWALSWFAAVRERFLLSSERVVLTAPGLTLSVAVPEHLS